MLREDLVDLNAFLTVAQERSFTRAAAKLGISQSALSHTVRRLETRLGVRLLMRTTRNVAPTEAGERLLATLGPAFDSIAGELASVGELRERPAGTIRLTTSEHVARSLILPALARLLPAYPDIHVELTVDSGLANIVADGFDAGVRLGEALAKDMVGVRIGPDLRMIVVAAPAYLERHPPPRTPDELGRHACVNLRLTSAGGLYPWELSRDGRDVRVRVEGQLVSNNMAVIKAAAVAGLGLAIVMQDEVAGELSDGRLVIVMDDWCESFAGYYLYYPSRRQPSAAFALVVDALRYRSG